MPYKRSDALGNVGARAVSKGALHVQVVADVMVVQRVPAKAVLPLMYDVSAMLAPCQCHISAMLAPRR
eukprot:128275-Pyramimonas_sp.AAC.1